MSKIYKCPVCGDDLRIVVFAKPNSSGELFSCYNVKCYTCSLFGESVCNCDKYCTSDSHFEKAFLSLKKGAFFLKDYILKGGFND